jgi:hypothetical protein
VGEVGLHFGRLSFFLLQKQKVRVLVACLFFFCKNKKFAFWSLVFFLFHTARAALFFPGHWGSRVMSFRCATRRSLTFVAAASASAYARMSFTQPPSPVQKMQRAP